MRQGSVLVVGLNFPPEPAGIAPYTGGLASALSASGVDVSVITTFPHYPAWSFGATPPPWSDTSHVAGFAVRRVRHKLPARPGGLSRLASEVSFGARAVTQRWARHDVLVLVSPALFSSAIALLRARVLRRRMPVVTWVQDLYSLGLRETGTGSGLGVRVVAAVERWVLKRSTTVVVIHDRFKRTVVEELGVPESRVVVMRNWTHFEPPAVADRVGARETLGWAPDETVVLHAGNMGVKQGLGNVVEAARLAEKRGLRIRFVLLGDGNQREQLERLAFGVPNLQFLSPLPDGEFAAALNAADVLLVNEAPGVSGMAVPSKLTSYFATGVPVLAATDPGSVTRSEVLSADAGPVVAAGEPSELVDAVLALAADEEARQRHGRAARAYRASHLSAGAALDRFQSILHELLPDRFRASSSDEKTGIN
ncbi:glycosyltransferase family 4 protein [Curtobacterium flaccumfaciens pv. flaccumfaciens]|nr:glycosyltransferase family 4 protein [Curtobacterium flaccumfaciens pv. flaccumfaciens]